MEMDIKKYVGKIFWTSPNIDLMEHEDEIKFYMARITRAILTEEKFSMDWLSNEFPSGGAVLKVNNQKHLFGKAVFYDGESNVECKISGDLYLNPNGCLIKGIWIEEGSEWTWIAELKKTEKFPDEK